MGGGGHVVLIDNHPCIYLVMYHAHKYKQRGGPVWIDQVCIFLVEFLIHNFVFQLSTSFLLYLVITSLFRDNGAIPNQAAKFLRVLWQYSELSVLLVYPPCIWPLHGNECKLAATCLWHIVYFHNIHACACGSQVSCSLHTTCIPVTHVHVQSVFL